MTTDTTERGLERLICTALTGHPCDPPKPGAGAATAGWTAGDPRDYDRNYCVDLVQLSAFLHATQPDAADALALDEDGPARRKFLARLQGAITKRGTIDVLRKGLGHGAHELELFYGTPSEGNEAARQRFDLNRFTVTRQLRYSGDRAQLALDLALFVNGLPVVTFELKNSLTKQTVSDAVEQYRKDRNPREKLFEFGRCIVHFAADEREVRFCTHRAIVAFSGEHEYGGEKVTEASLNGFPSRRIAEKIKEHPYRFLVCADKFQTGYDEPLLHTMYVDKTLAGIKAVQTLSRLNRAHPGKHDVFVLDFLNDTEIIRDSFANYYRGTILADETDPDRLHDLQAGLDAAQVCSAEQIDTFVERYLDGDERDRLDPILDRCVAVYLSELDEDGQVDFKGKAKAFVRAYGFLSSILPFSNAGWEKRSIFLNFLIPKLPAPREEDLARGILDAVDMDSYRAEKRATQKILLPDEDAEVDPAPPAGGGQRPESDLDHLSNIVKAFNDHFGGIEWADEDRVQRMIAFDIPARVASDTAFRNAGIEHDRALLRVMQNVMKDDTELFKQFMDNDGFKRWMSEAVFRRAYDQAEAP